MPLLSDEEVGLGQKRLLTDEEVGLTEGSDEIAQRAELLPLGRTESGDLTLAMPGFLEGPRQTIIDILEGKKTARDLSGKEIFELGALFAGGAPGTPRGGIAPGPPLSKNAPKPAPKPTPAPVSEGEAIRQAGARQGVDLPRAVTSDSSVVQQAGKITSQVPVGGQPLRQASERAVTQLDEAAKRTEATFGGGDAARAGTAAEKGITDFAGKGGVLAAREEAKYNKVADLVNAQVINPLTETKKAAETILARRQGAAITSTSKAVKEIEDAIARPGLNYEGTKNLRTYIGELMDNPSLVPSDIRGSELKQIYSALTKDLRSVVEVAGNERALKAFEQANKFSRQAAGLRENLNRVLKVNSPEAVTARIEGLAKTTSRADRKLLAQARAAMPPQAWDEIASAVISNMGRAPDGTFSPTRFLGPRGYSGLSDAGKKILFSSTGKPELKKALDDIAKVSSRFKQLEQFANPSGTGQTVLGGALGAGFIADPMTAVTSIVSARVLAEILARPSTAKPLAEWSKAYELAARQPGPQATRIFRERSKALAAAIAAELGIPDVGPTLTDMLEGTMEAVLSAAKLPGDVFAGRVDPMSKEAIERSANLVGMIGGVGAARTAFGKTTGQLGASGGRMRLPPMPSKEQMHSMSKKQLGELYRGLGATDEMVDFKMRGTKDGLIRTIIGEYREQAVFDRIEDMMRGGRE